MSDALLILGFAIAVYVVGLWILDKAANGPKKAAAVTEYAKHVAANQRATENYERLRDAFVKGHGDGIDLMAAWWVLEETRAQGRSLIARGAA